MDRDDKRHHKMLEKTCAIDKFGYKDLQPTHGKIKLMIIGTIKINNLYRELTRTITKGSTFSRCRGMSGSSGEMCAYTVAQARPCRITFSGTFFQMGCN